MDVFARRAKAAGERGATRRIDQAEAFLDDLAEFEKRLLAVIEGQVECEIPDWAEGSYRGGVYDPVLDNGVKVSIMPLQAGEVLRYKKLVYCHVLGSTLRLKADLLIGWRE